MVRGRVSFLEARPQTYPPNHLLNHHINTMKKVFLSLFLALYIVFGLSGCKSFVTSAPEQWVAKIDDAMVLIEDTKGLIELARELGMEWVTLVKQKDGTYTVKDNTEKVKEGDEVSADISARTQGLMSTSLTPSNEIKVRTTQIIRRTRVVH